jgi:uncharacterized protein YkwD
MLDGARRGMVPYLTELAALGFGLTLALALFDPLGRVLHAGLAADPTLADFGSFLLLLALGRGAAQIPAHRAAKWAAARLEGRVEQPRLRRAGAIPAAAVVTLVAAVLASALSVTPAGPARGIVAGSTLGSALADHAGPIQDSMRLLVAAPRPIPSMNQVADSGEDTFYKLEFPADLTTRVDPAAEEDMVRRINQARAANSLSPLRMDPTLRAIARAHSLDMYERRYFSHQTPDGRSPYDRFNEFKAAYLTAGENIAFAPTPDMAWSSLMHNPDHRANILNPDFRCVGVGAYRGLPGYEEMFTQDFSDCA